MIRVLAVAVVAAVVTLAPASGRADGEFSVIVPDHTPFIQAALDSGARWVYVRPGFYPEHLVLQQPADILALATESPPGPDSLPVIGGMTLAAVPPSWDCKADGDVFFTDLHFTGGVENTFTDNDCANSLAFIFTRCVLDSGLTDQPATRGGQLDWNIRSSTIRGDVVLGRPQYIGLFDNVITGRAIVSASEAVALWRNRFVGPGDTAISISRRRLGPTIAYNQIGGFDTGIWVGERDGASIAGNLIEDCGTGIATTPGEAYEVTDNIVRRCSRAMVLSGEMRAVIARNLVEDCGFGIGHHGVESVTAQRNVVRRCATGLDLITYEGLLSEDNRIEDVQGIGIRGADGRIIMRRDTVLSCGEGIVVVGSDGRVEISDARVLGCTGRGIAMINGTLRNPVLITGNVVGRCGADGLSMVGEYSSRIHGNTSFLNGGSGFVFDAYEGTDHVFENNLAYGNAHHGLVRNWPDLLLSCNDWFANDSGAVSGGVPGATDLAVDPLFCDLDADDVRLRSDSPLVDAPGCGLIGAQGVGCADLPTPVVVSRFSAERTSAGVLIQWRLHEFTSDGWLERAEHRAGPYARIVTERQRSGSEMQELDRGADPARPYWYRLVLPDPDGGWPVATIEVAAAPSQRFEIAAVTPNPAQSLARIEFTTPHAASIEVAVFDLQGRRVATLASGTWPAGRHQVQWDGAMPTGVARPGLYLVRYRYPGGVGTRRLMLER